MPALESYRCTKATIRAKKDIIGEMRLVELSPMRKTPCTSSGDNPSNMNMGTNTGAIKAHWADALPTQRLMTAARRTKHNINGIGPSPEASRTSAPLMAKIIPRLVYLKYATNWAAKKTRTM